MSNSGQMKTASGQVLASVGAIASVMAASSCCLPLLPFVTAAAAAGSSALLTTLRPYLLGLSVLLIGYGFWQARRLKQCRCKPSLWSTILLWSSAVIVIAMVFFPQAIVALLAG